MLPEVEITATRSKVNESNSLDLSTEDFSYLKFDVTDYMESDIVNTVISEDIPEVPLTDFSYLKFDVTKYMEIDDANAVETEDLP